MKKIFISSITVMVLFTNPAFSSNGKYRDGRNSKNKFRDTLHLPDKGEIDENGERNGVQLYNPKEVLKYKLIGPRIAEYLNAEGDQNLYGAMSFTEILTDRVLADMISSKRERVLYRDNEVNQILDVLIKESGSKYPVLYGGSGAGKSAVLDQLAYQLVVEDYPEGPYGEALKHAVIFEVSARRFKGGDIVHGNDLMSYLKAFDRLEKSLGIQIIFVIQEAHFLSAAETSVLHELIRIRSTYPIIIEADNKSMSMMTGASPGLAGALSPIRVSEPTPEQVRDIIKLRLIDQLHKKFGIVLEQDVIDTAIKLSVDYKKEKSDPQRSLDLVEDFAINFNRKHEDGNYTPTKTDLYKFVAQKLGYPVVPQDEEAFARFIENLKVQVKNDVIDQDHLVDGLIDQFSTALQSQRKKHSTAMVMGPTGVGKTYVAERISHHFYGSSERVLDLDMTQFGDEHMMEIHFDAANGYESEKTNKGVI